MSGWGLSSSGWAVGISVGDNGIGLLWELPNWRVLCSSCLNAFLTFCLTLSFRTSLSYTKNVRQQIFEDSALRLQLSQPLNENIFKEDFSDKLVRWEWPYSITLSCQSWHLNWSETTNFEWMVTSQHTNISFKSTMPRSWHTNINANIIYTETWFQITLQWFVVIVILLQSTVDCWLIECLLILFKRYR